MRVGDYIENHHGDAFANVNLGMLNGRFQDNEFTCISTSGKSVVDYICDPYEEMEFIVNVTANINLSFMLVRIKWGNISESTGLHV
jgi:hypothetical protein